MSLIEFCIKQNDTRPIIQATLTDVTIDGGSTARFLMRLRGDKSSKVAATATISDNGPPGVVRYNWAAGDTDTAGIYEGEFEITFSDGKIETYPNGEYIRITILEDAE